MDLERVRHRRVLVPLIVTLAVAVGAGIAVASHGGGGHVYYACLTNGGALNNVTIDATPTCNGSSTTIDPPWVC